MKYFLFLSKVATIAGICFLLLFLNKFLKFLGENSISKTIATLGYPVSYTLNAILLLAFIIWHFFNNRFYKHFSILGIIYFGMVMAMQLFNFLYL